MDGLRFISISLRSSRGLGKARSGEGELGSFVFGLAVACIVALLLERNLRLIQNEVDSITGVYKSTSTRVAAAFRDMVAAIKGMRSQIDTLQDRNRELGEQLNELAGQIETLSKRANDVQSFTRRANAVTTGVDDIKQSAIQLEEEVASTKSPLPARAPRVEN